jgi:fumarylacetoacetate (FAA) hydrolase
MKLATLRDGTRDGRLVIVDRDLRTFTPADDIAPTLQHALDNWARVLPQLYERQRDPTEALPFDPIQFDAPLPRAYEWVDGSAFLNHVVLVRKARNAEPPPTLETDPLVYQGGSSIFLGPTEVIDVPDASWGCDFEAEVCAILGDVPVGAQGDHVRLFMLANDVTYRNLVPAELAKGFGFFQSKPATAFSPVAVTPDELGPAWRDGRVHLRLRTTLNDNLAGDPDAGEMHFSFFDLTRHIARTRAFSAGTILGSGTVSNADRARGISCLAERRAIETIETGAPRTPWLTEGDRVHIEMRDAEGRSIFGAIDQTVRIRTA